MYDGIDEGNLFLKSVWFLFLIFLDVYTRKHTILAQNSLLDESILLCVFIIKKLHIEKVVSGFFLRKEFIKIRNRSENSCIIKHPNGKKAFVLNFLFKNCIREMFKNGHYNNQYNIFNDAFNWQIALSQTAPSITHSWFRNREGRGLQSQQNGWEKVAIRKCEFGFISSDPGISPILQRATLMAWSLISKFS